MSETSTAEHIARDQQAVTNFMRNAAPPPELSAEEAAARKKDAEEERDLEKALTACRESRVDAEADLAALEEKSRKAGATSFMSSMGIEARPANETVQRECRSFFPLAGQQLREAQEAERKAEVLYRSAQTAHGQRRARVEEMARRENDRQRAEETAARLVEEKRAARQALKKFLAS